MNIYVSHLSWGTKSDSLQNLFSQYGEVSSANVITDRETGRSRGFGFVEMPNETEDRLRSTRSTAPTSKARPSESMSQSPRQTDLPAVTAVATVAAVTAAATATGDTKLPYGIYHPCFMRLRQGSLFCPVSQGYEEIHEGCSVSERGRRTPEHRKKGGNCRPHRPGLACRVTRGAHQNFARITTRLKAGHTPDRK